MYVCVYVCITKNQLKTCLDLALRALRVRSQEVRKFCFESKELTAMGSKVLSTSFNLIRTTSVTFRMCAKIYFRFVVFTRIQQKKFKNLSDNISNKERCTNGEAVL